MKNLFNFESVFDDDYYTYLQQNRDDKKEIEFLIDALHLKKEDKILDVGTGNGRLLFSLHDRGYSNLTGIDFSKAMIEVAKKNLNHRKISFVFDDFLKYSFQNKYDKIISFFSGFGYFDDETNNVYIKKVTDLLLPDGMFLLDLANAELIKKIQKREKTRKVDNIEYSVKSYFDKKKKILITNCFVKDDENNKTKEYSFAYRIYDKKEIENIFFQNNLEIVDVFGNYDGVELNESSPRAIYVAKKLNSC